jgi:hypothetical protein
MISMKRTVTCLSIVAAVLLSACGSEADPEATAAPAPKTTAPADPIQKMARAVGDGKPGAAVGIRYDFLGKPAVGTPTELEIALIPNAGVDSLAATITGMEGVTLSGPLTANFTGVEPGKPYSHKISVLPDRTGVFYITVSVSTQIGQSALGRTFSIPFVVGNVPAQQKAAAPRDASGEAIQSMKAQEEKK